MTSARYYPSDFVLGSRVIACTVMVFVSTIGGTVLSFATEPGRSDGAKVPLEAAQLYARGDLGGAVRLLQRSVAADPTNAQLHFMLANALFRQKDWSTAAKQYEEAVRLKDHHPDSYLGLGYACFQAGRTDEAIKAWRTAVRLMPNDAFAYLSLCVGLLRQGQTASARQCLLRAIELDPAWKQRVAIDVRWNPEMIREVEAITNPSVSSGTKQKTKTQPINNDKK